MKIEDLVEFILMLLIENKVKGDDKFYEYFLKKANKKKFNARYQQLLDDFLNLYALNKTEKSEEHD